MVNRSLLLFFVTSLSLVNIPAHAMSWDFWTRDNYKHTWIASGAIAAVGLACCVWQYINKPETPEEYYKKATLLINKLHTTYDVKIVAFEQGYNVTSSDIGLKNEQLEQVKQKWLSQIDEEALAYLGSFGSWNAQTLQKDVRAVSAIKIELSKMRRQCLQENTNPGLARDIQELLTDVSLLFLRLSFLSDCVTHHQSYLDFLVHEKAIHKQYAFIMHSSSASNIKEIVCKNSTEKSYQYVKFAQNLHKDLRQITQVLSQVPDAIKNTQIFKKTQRTHTILTQLEKRIFADQILHNDLQEYQVALIKNMRKIAKKLSVAIDRVQIEIDRVIALENRLSAIVAAYSAYHALANQNGQQNAISMHEMNELRSLNRKRENIGVEIQKARDVKHSLTKKLTTIQERFDKVRSSAQEQLQLQEDVEKITVSGENTLKTLQFRERDIRDIAQDLYNWANKNNLLLV